LSDDLLNERKRQFISVLHLILLGVLAALFTSLLIYFKQKEALHLILVLSLVGLIFLLIQRIQNQLLSPTILKSLSLSILILLAWAGPQLIYEIRPYTFYITGIVIVAVLSISIATVAIYDQKSIRFPIGYIIFLVAFAGSYQIPWNYQRYLAIILSVLLTGIFVIGANGKVKLALAVLTITLIVGYGRYSKPLTYFPDQQAYEDKVQFSANTQFHKLVVTEWQDDYWVFIDNLKNLSSIDDFLFYEPMAHSVFSVGDKIKTVLVIGGENGCLIREIVKHDQLELVDILSYDTLMRKIAEFEPIFVEINQGSYEHQKTNIIREELIDYLSSSTKKYDAIFIDLPDPRSVETNQYYTSEFYLLVRHLLSDLGLMITQAGSPYFATSAFLSVGETIKSAGFHVLPLHNQILTLGEWGWYLCSAEISGDSIKGRLLTKDRYEIKTKWYNQEAAKLITSFGKVGMDTLLPAVNTLENPIVYRHYLQGNWDLN